MSVEPSLLQQHRDCQRFNHEQLRQAKNLKEMVGIKLKSVEGLSDPL